MFSLLIVLISIALVIGLAVASLWYGGVIFTNNGLKAKAATVMAAGNQISGAVEAYKAQKGDIPGTVADLVSTNLLSTVPDGNWVFANDYIVQSTVDAATCTEANRQLGITGIPQCTDTSVNGITACCSS